MVNGAIVARDWKTEGGLGQGGVMTTCPKPPHPRFSSAVCTVFRFTQCTPRKGYLFISKSCLKGRVVASKHVYILLLLLLLITFLTLFPRKLRVLTYVRVKSTILADRFGISVVVEAKLSSSLLPFQTLTLISVQNGNSCWIAFKCQICIHLFSSAAVHYDRI